MKCKCSLNNNYQIIGLCDIEKYNEKIRAFNDKSWTQITLPEKLTLPSDAKDLKNIVKVYIDIKITSTKIINTPVSGEPNTEGLKLTGKILLTSGTLCQKIIYIADNCNNSMHSVKFNIPFNTYIVIDENTNIDNDKYCVYPCIEDVSVRALDKRHLSKSITLFLFAHKIVDVVPPGPPQPVGINNEFIFYDYPLNPKTEVIKVAFDLDNKRLIVTSTGNRYNPIDDRMALGFDLTDSTGRVTKAQGIVRKDEDGTDFRNSLNNTEFEIGDLIFINYQIGQNTVLTNFPTLGQDYDMSFVGNRTFEITQSGIVPTMLPNVISLNAVNGEAVINIGFDTHLQILLPKESASEQTNPAFRGQEYFTMIVKESTGREKYRASIQGDQYGIELTKDLINKTFEYGDIVELTYKEGDKVQITVNTSTKYSLSGTTSSFTIERNGLIPVSTLPPIPIEKLPNKITIKSKNDQEVATIEFNKDTSKFIVNSTGVVPDLSSNQPYITLKLTNNEGRKTQDFTLNSNENGENFKNALNDRDFDFNDNKLFIYYQDKSKIEISNYPNIGNNYIPNEDANIFEITNISLADGAIAQKIKFINDNNEEMARIQFNKSPKFMYLVVATGNNLISTDNLEVTKEYASIVNLQGGSTIFGAKILGRGNAQNIVSTFNNFGADTGLTRLLLASRFSSKVIITNYKGQSEYKINPEKFELVTYSNSQLEEYTLTPYNIIKLKNRDGSYIVSIHLYDDRPAFLVNLVGLNKNNDTTSFNFKIKNSNNVDIKFQGTINRGETGDVFKDSIQGFEKRFNYNDILEISYSDGSLVEITDIPNKGDVYNPSGNFERFRLTRTGLQKIINVQSQKLLNEFILSNSQGQEMLRIEFDTTNKKFLATATDAINNEQSKESQLLFFQMGSVKQTLNFGVSAKEFALHLNNTPFIIGNSFFISYYNISNNNFKITNYPNQGENYTPRKIPSNERFQITESGLVKL